MAVTRNDVARAADVSPAVVSYVLNNGPRPVSLSARKRVLDAVDALGYRPDGRARSLRTRTSNIIGLIVPDAANPFFAELARAIEEAAYAVGKAVLVCNSADDVGRERAYLNALVEKRVDGIVLAAASGSEDLTDVLAVGIPVVAMDRFRVESEVTIVRFDDRHAGLLAGQHLIEHGRHTIALIAGPESLPVSSERSAGVRASGLTVIREIAAPFDFAGGFNATLALIKSDLTIDGLICSSDVQAIGALAALRRTHTSVPDDLAVVAIDGTQIGAFTTPPLTSVRQPLADMSSLAVGALARRLPDRHSALAGELVVRESCGCRVSSPT